MSIKTHTFKNGFRLIWEKSYNRVPLTTIYIFCNVGSIHEPHDIKGAAHFIEHMCFKGTKTMPLAKDIYGEYDEIGAKFNASTDKHYTNYYVRTQDQYAAHCMHMLSDMVLNSIFKRSELLKEEHVVIEENIRNADDTGNIAVEMMDRLIYKGSPYNLPIDTLDYHKKSFDYGKVVDMYRQYYVPSNMILSIATNLEFDDVVKMIKKTYFVKTDKSADKNISSCLRLSYTSPIQSEIQYNIFEKPDLKAMKILISFRTCGMHNKDKYSLNLLRRILSGSLGSRLSLLLREDNGLTYTSDIYTTYYEATGEFTIVAELDKTKLIHNGKKRGVLPLIIGMLNDLIQTGVTADEVKRVHTNFLGSDLFKMEYNMSQAFHNGQELLNNTNLDDSANNSYKVVQYKDIYDVYYKDIKKKDLNRIVDTYLKKTNMNVCLVGSDLVSLSIIKKECEKIVQ